MKLRQPPVLEGPDLRSFVALIDIRPGCWVWLGKKDSGGYGRFENWLAHRLAYASFVGPVAAGMFVCHHCDNPPCINPAHLFVGSAADNNRDKAAKGRSANVARQSIDLASLPLPVRELAALLGVSPRTVQRYRRAA